MVSQGGGTPKVCRGGISSDAVVNEMREFWPHYSGLCTAAPPSKKSERSVCDWPLIIVFKDHVTFSGMCGKWFDWLLFCRNCLCALKKRRALLSNLHEVNSSIQKIVQSKKCSAVPLPVPTPSSNRISDSQEQATKCVALEDFGASVTSVDIKEDNSALPNRTSVD